MSGSRWVVTGIVLPTHGLLVVLGVYQLIASYLNGDKPARAYFEFALPAFVLVGLATIAGLIRSLAPGTIRLAAVAMPLVSAFNALILMAWVLVANGWLPRADGDTSLSGASCVGELWVVTLTFPGIVLPLLCRAVQLTLARRYGEASHTGTTAGATTTAAATSDGGAGTVTSGGGTVNRHAVMMTSGSTHRLSDAKQSQPPRAGEERTSRTGSLIVPSTPTTAAVAAALGSGMLSRSINVPARVSAAAMPSGMLANSSEAGIALVGTGSADAAAIAAAGGSTVSVGSYGAGARAGAGVGPYWGDLVSPGQSVLSSSFSNGFAPPVATAAAAPATVTATPASPPPPTAAAKSHPAAAEVVVVTVPPQNTGGGDTVTSALLAPTVTATVTASDALALYEPQLSDVQSLKLFAMTEFAFLLFAGIQHLAGVHAMPRVSFACRSPSNHSSAFVWHGFEACVFVFVLNRMGVLNYHRTRRHLRLLMENSFASLATAVVICILVGQQLRVSDATIDPRAYGYWIFIRCGVVFALAITWPLYTEELAEVAIAETGDERNQSLESLLQSPDGFDAFQQFMLQSDNGDRSVLLLFYMSVGFYRDLASAEERRTEAKRMFAEFLGPITNSKSNRNAAAGAALSSVGGGTTTPPYSSYVALDDDTAAAGGGGTVTSTSPSILGTILPALIVSDLRAVIVDGTAPSAFQNSYRASDPFGKHLFDRSQMASSESETPEASLSPHGTSQTTIPPTEAKFLARKITEYGWRTIFATVFIEMAVAGVGATLLLVRAYTPPAANYADAEADACDVVWDYADRQLRFAGFAFMVAVCAVMIMEARQLYRRRAWWWAVPIAILSQVHIAVATHKWLTAGVPKLVREVASCRGAHPVLFWTARINVYIVLLLASVMALIIAFSVGSILYQFARRGQAAKKEHSH